LELFRRIRSFSGLVLALAKSPQARAQLRCILAREKLPPPPVEPEGPDFIDVRTLLNTLTVEQLARTADEYFDRAGDTDIYVAMPFNNVDDASALLVAFCHVLAGLNPRFGSTILDFGAGTCWSTRCLVQLGQDVIAMDVSKNALDMGRELFRRLPIAGFHVPPAFMVFDGRRFDLPDQSVDRIMCLNAFHHVPNPAEVLREMARVLRPGGIAGFSEPGPGHSRTAQAQYEMRHYTVIENDIVMEDIERWALEAGFSRLKMMVFDSRPYLLDPREYQSLVDGGLVAEQYVDFVRQAASSRQAFFLYKDGVSVPDSRERRGLNGTVRVTFDSPRAASGDVLHGEAEVTNTGANVWLPSDARFGPVLIGVHLFGRDGATIDRDFSRVRLPRGLAPGESARFRFTVPAPPPGDYRLGFDLVSEQVCWFEMNGSEVALVDVTVA
jgi:SAM-dependent methyltransferase